MESYRGWKEIRAALLVGTLIALMSPISGEAAEETGNTDRDIGYWQSYQDGSWRYYDTEGSYAVDTWRWLSDDETFNWYHFDGQGYLTTGWLIDDESGSCYYFDPESGAMVTGRQDIEGYEYFFDKAGLEQSGWIYDSKSGYWIYYKKDEVPLDVLIDNDK